MTTERTTMSDAEVLSSDENSVTAVAPFDSATSVSARQRSLFETTLARRQDRWDLDRPAIFSPAAAAQDVANGTGVFFRWTPLMLAWEFTQWTEEALAHTETCFLGDWSALGTLRLRGAQALPFLQHVGVNDLSSLPVDGVKHSIQCDENGFVASEGILYRTDDDTFLYQGGGVDWTAWQLKRGHWDVEGEVISPEMFLFHVQGPTSIHAVEAATGQDLRDLPFHGSRRTVLAGCPVRILRAGVSGELGYEVHGYADDANAVWTALAEAGGPHGLRLLGVRSQLVAHIEAGVATTGLDYLPASIVTPGAPKLIPSGAISGSFVPRQGVTDFFRYPAELGWPRSVDLDGHDFIGRDALRRQADEGGAARRLVGLVWNADDVASLFAAQFEDGPLPDPMDMPRTVGASFDQVLSGGEAIGISSGRTYSPHLRDTISLCVLSRELAVPGTEVSVLWGNPGTPQREIRATVARSPLKERRQHVLPGA
jgi:glycine cleavage system aminomethyltransferase T